jgi:hypothetical protein
MNKRKQGAARQQELLALMNKHLNRAWLIADRLELYEVCQRIEKVHPDWQETSSVSRH